MHHYYITEREKKCYQLTIPKFFHISIPTSLGQLKIVNLFPFSRDISIFVIKNIENAAFLLKAFHYYLWNFLPSN